MNVDNNTNNDVNKSKNPGPYFKITKKVWLSKSLCNGNGLNQ